MVQAAFKEDRKNNPYLVQKVMTASPEQLVVYVFDAALIACARRNKSKSIEAVQALISSIRFDHQDIATTFFNTYGSIINYIKKDDFPTAEKLLSEIKKTWKIAMNVQ